MSIKIKGASGGAGLPGAWWSVMDITALEAITQYAAVERGSGGVRNITADGYKKFGTADMLGVGMALSDAESGQSIRVCLFAPINGVWGG